MRTDYRHAPSHKERIEMAKRAYLTTGDAASVLNVSQQTVIRLFDTTVGTENSIGFRTPPSRYRRLFKNRVEEHARELRLPVPSLHPATLVPTGYDHEEDSAKVMGQAPSQPSQDALPYTVEYHDAMTLAMEMAEHPVTRIVANPALLQDSANGVRKKIDDLCRRHDYPAPEVVDMEGAPTQSHWELALEQAAESF